MTMKLEQIKEGAYVRWVAERYLKSWDIHGKIVEVSNEVLQRPTGSPDQSSHQPKDGPRQGVSILGFDDMKINTVNTQTVMEECEVVPRDEAMRSASRNLVKAKKKLIDMEVDLEFQKGRIKTLTEQLENI